MKTSQELLALLLLLVSCTDSLDVRDGSGRYVSDDLGHEMLVLGEQLSDPYSIDNVVMAVKSLYPEKGARVDIKPTDIYVRFLPSDDSELERLESLGIFLIDHPLDYSIVKEGDYYHDPSIDENSITWQYAVVPSDFNFPRGIEFEILDKCYIADNDVTTRADGIDWAAVEAESFRLTGNAGLLASQETKGGSGACAPSGRIEIVDEDYNSGKPIGVAGVMVCVNSFVKFATCQTDGEGYYEMKKKFSSDVRYRIVFKNKKGFGIGVNLLLVPASISTLGKNSPQGVDVKVTKDSDWKMFTRCVVNNAAYDYYEKYSGEDSSILPPPSDLRIWIFRKLSDSAAPMLQQGVLLENGLISKYLGEYADLVRIFLPDITLGLKDTNDYASIYSTVCHELAHSSHFMLAGKSYWSAYVCHVLKSFVSSGESYGSGTEKNAGYCEVGEMWAYYMENVVFRDRYGRDSATRGVSFWFYPQIFLYLDERGLDAEKIFRVLTSDVNSRETLRTALADTYPEYRTIVEQAFERYGY